MAAPFDLQSKLLMEEDPRVVLYALAGIPMDEPVEVEQVDREVTIGTKRIDHAYKVTRNGVTAIEHFETTTNFSHVNFDDIYERSILLDVKHKLPVHTRIVLMTALSMPVDPPLQHIVNRGTNVRIHAVEFVCIWRLPGKLALDLDRPALLTWVPLMDSTAEEQAEAARRVYKDRELMTRFAVLFGLRYRKRERFERLELMNSFLTEEIMRESWVVQEWLQKGHEAGLQVGLQAGLQSGLLEGRQQIVRSLLEDKFGAIPLWVEERLKKADSAQIDLWGHRILRAVSLDDVFS